MYELKKIHGAAPQFSLLSGSLLVFAGFCFCYFFNSHPL